MIDHIAGKGAFGGKKRGKVRIVPNGVNITEFEFNEGDILVAPDTMSNLRPLMKKAGAIVVDEGGLMCHAAIAARELKTPCVVGTKVATQLLQDGDTVEVDADAGTVSKIEPR